MEPAFLEDRAVLAISGPEAREFLQGLVTNDVIGGLAPGSGLYTALLSPQGKILFDFLVTEGDGALLLDTAKDTAEALLKKLKMYKLRAKVGVELREPLGVYVNLAGHPDNRLTPYADRAVTFTDPRLAALGQRSIGAHAEMPANLAGPRAYHEHRIALGVPEAGDFGFEKTFALDAGLDELNGVSFTKGCYIGQELTSRMKHRATSRKRILTVTAEAPLPAPGARVTRGGAEIGELVSVYGAQGFALVRLDRLEEISGDVLIEENPVALNKPAWLS
ncbi:MAG: folate-binding protein YgfZ [Alphaproteobacteria bacterium]|nr:folate-binding protein YgfZ [Alphaproteobacteria bacterium]